MGRGIGGSLDTGNGGRIDGFAMLGLSLPPLSFTLSASASGGSRPSSASSIPLITELLMLAKKPLTTAELSRGYGARSPSPG
jgi:hypothetical protein